MDDILNYVSAIILVLLLLALFAFVLRYASQGGRFVPKFLSLQPRSESIPIRIVAIKVLDARRKIVIVDCGTARYVLMLSHTRDQLLDKLSLPAVTPDEPPPPKAGRAKRSRRVRPSRPSLHPSPP